MSGRSPQQIPGHEPEDDDGKPRSAFERLAEALYVFAALVLAFLPVVLWMSWSRPMLGYSLLSGAIAFAYITVFCFGPKSILRGVLQPVINTTWHLWHWQRRIRLWYGRS
ncbi:MAG: hypothetical protein KDK91_12930 [Gammaproteobacteria bacterium]|nr:hypothetical protein [Gammaproteobacteria bacterium]